MTAPQRTNPRHLFGPRPPASQPRRTTPTPITTLRLEAGSLLSAQTVAAMLEVSKATAQRLITAGRLGEPVRVGRSVRVHRSAVEQYVANGGHTG